MDPTTTLLLKCLLNEEQGKKVTHVGFCHICFFDGLMFSDALVYPYILVVDICPIHVNYLLL